MQEGCIVKCGLVLLISHRGAIFTVVLLLLHLHLNVSVEKYIRFVHI